MSKYGHCGEWSGLKGGWASVKIRPHWLLWSLRREEVEGGGNWLALAQTQSLQLDLWERLAELSWQLNKQEDQRPKGAYHPI